LNHYKSLVSPGVFFTGVAYRLSGAFGLASRNLPSTAAMQCFETAARHMSFTRAADELNLTQSAVSKQVAHLETALQHKLFRRVRRSSERDLQPRCGGWLD